MQLVNTFDVEPWWATVPPCVDRSDWDDMPDRSEAPLRQYMDLCDEAGVKCTFFFLGWYAQRFPDRIAEVVRRGHEAGCHSLNHEDVATQSDEQFYESTRVAKAAIESAAGVAVTAYRAPSFSFPPARFRELLGMLAQLGFTLDSSVSTAARVHGGGYCKSEFPGPMSLTASHGIDMFEVPVPGVTLFGKDVQIFGGGYLRLAPMPALRHFVRTESYQVLYMHPHDFDRNLPPLPGRGGLADLRRRLNLGDPIQKMRELFSNCTVRSCGQLQAETRISHV